MNLLSKVSMAGTLISFLGMVAAVVIQVFARFFLPVAPNWTEEVARILFIYTIAFGGGLAIRNDAFVRLDFLRHYLNAATYRKLQILVMCSIVIFSGLMVYQSGLFMWLGVAEKSPALLISMIFVFFSLLLMMCSLFLFSIEKLIHLINSEPTLS